ncbi:HAD family hydrolase [Pseudomonas sp. nanlin1]|uniref:HAD family hydrolase n=1 Tax=Pseudomonas sp. nanlin1 TaxID=3040605 RepID=UPI003890B737
MSIQLITFDLDDTLWDTAPVIISAESALREWLNAHAPRLGPLPVEQVAEIRKRMVDADPSLKYRISFLRQRVLAHALAEAGYAQPEAETLAEQAFAVFLEARQQVEVFPQAQPALALLAQSYTLGVITNGNADVHRIGLGEHFAFALCAEDMAIGKPDARLFQEALRRGGVPAGAAVHVGDHPGDDIAGAQAAGMRAIWYNPRRLPWQGDGRPDAEVASLSEIAEAVRAL